MFSLIQADDCKHPPYTVGVSFPLTRGGAILTAWISPLPSYFGCGDNPSYPCAQELCLDPKGSTFFCQPSSDPR
jgi:hypothetical protein